MLFCACIFFFIFAIKTWYEYFRCYHNYLIFIVTHFILWNFCSTPRTDTYKTSTICGLQKTQYWQLKIRKCCRSATYIKYLCNGECKTKNTRRAVNIKKIKTLIISKNYITLQCYLDVIGCTSSSLENVGNCPVHTIHYLIKR